MIRIAEEEDYNIDIKHRRKKKHKFSGRQGPPHENNHESTAMAMRTSRVFPRQILLAPPRSVDQGPPRQRHLEQSIKNVQM